jgi:inner membrane protease subunit 2
MSQWRDVVIFDRMSVRLFGYFARGDVVSLKYVSLVIMLFLSIEQLWNLYMELFRSPINPKMMLVKRILAVEGDVVNTLPPYPDAEVRVPEGHIWVEGFNQTAFATRTTRQLTLLSF